MSQPFETPGQQPAAPEQPAAQPFGAPQATPAYGAPQEAPAYGAPQAAPAQPGFQQPYYGAQDALMADLKSKGTLSLILSIVGLVFIGLFGTIPGWVIGANAVKKARSAGIPEDFVSSAKIGKIIGIIGTIVHLLIGVLTIFFFGAFIFAAMNNPQFAAELSNM